MTDRIPVPVPRPPQPALAAVESPGNDDLGQPYQLHVEGRRTADAADELLARVARRGAAKAPGAAPEAAAAKPAAAQAPPMGTMEGVGRTITSGLNAYGDYALSSIYGTTVGAPAAIAGGVVDAAQNALGLIDDAAKWLNKNVADLTLPEGAQLEVSLPQVPNVTGTFQEGAIRAVTSFLVGFKGAGKIMGAVGAGAAGGEAAQTMARSVIADFVAMDPKGERLSNMWQTLGLPGNALTDYLAAQPGDSDAEGRFKNALEGVIPGALVATLTPVVRAWKASARAATAPVADGVPGAPAPAILSTGPQVAAKDIEDLLATPQPAQLSAARKVGQAMDQTAGVPLEEGAKGIAHAEHAPETFVNWARVDGPDDLKNAMAQMADAFPADITAARRDVQTFAQTKLGAQSENAWQVLVERRQGQPLNDRQSLAARQLWATSAAKVSELATLAAANPGEAALFAFRKQLATHHMIQKEVIAARTETARALSSWRIPAGSNETRAKEIQMLLAESGGADVTRELAQRIAILAKGGHVLGLDQAVEKGLAARTMDGVRQVFVNALLSNPKTHIVNTTSNLSVAFQQIMERYASERVSGVLGTDGGVAAGEAMAMTYGMLEGWKDGLRYAARSAMTGESGFGIGKVESARPSAIGASTREGSLFAQGTPLGRALDLVGQASRVPSQALVAEDEFFKTIGYRMELHAQALRMAADDVAKGEIPATALKGQVAKYLENPPENIKMAAVDQALYQTFNSAPDWFARNVMQMRERIPGAWVLLPFVRTPGNIMKYTTERTPLAPVLGRFRQDIQAGGARRDLALARVSAGTFTMMAAADLALSGMVTGGGPKDPISRAALPPGWQPYSYKYGDRYYSFNRMDAVGNLFGISADFVDVLHNSDFNRNDTKSMEELATVTALMAANGFLSKTYMTGVARTVDALSDPERDGGKFIQGLAAGFVTPAAEAAVARGLDPVSREVRSMADAIMARTPGLSDSLPPNRDVWGRELRYDSGLGWAYDMFSPVASRKEASEPVDREMATLQMRVEKPGRVVDFGDASIDLDRYPGAYSRYVELAGNGVRNPAWGMGAKDFLNNVITGRHPMAQIYRLYTAEGRKGFIRSTVSDARSQARKELLRDPRFADLKRAVSNVQSTPKIQGAPAIAAPPTLQ